MATQIAHINDESGLEIPSELVKQASLCAGDSVELVASANGGLALVKSENAPKPRRRKTIDEIVAGIPEGAVTGEYDWGPPQGVEVW